MNARHFHAKDAVDEGEVEIAYYLTKIALADFFAKLLHDNLIRKFHLVALSY